jgi:hypothetical protein
MINLQLLMLDGASGVKYTKARIATVQVESLLRITWMTITLIFDVLRSGGL